MEHEIDSRALSTPLAPGADMPGAPDHGARSQFGHLLFWEQIVIDIYRHIYIECWDRHHQSVFTSRCLFHPSPVHRCPAQRRRPSCSTRYPSSASAARENQKTRKPRKPRKPENQKTRKPRKPEKQKNRKTRKPENQKTRKPMAHRDSRRGRRSIRTSPRASSTTATSTCRFNACCLQPEVSG